MNSSNPYKTPEADLSLSHEGQTDETSPLSPRGRFGRLSYLAWGFLIYFMIFLVMGVLGYSGAIDMTSQEPSLVQILVSIPAAIVGFIFAIRRLHDLDSSAWWVLLMLVPIANIVLGFVLLLKAGTPGPNRFGPVRLTPVWERILGYIGIAMFILAFIGILAAILIPLMLSTQLPS